MDTENPPAAASETTTTETKPAPPTVSMTPTLSSSSSTDFKPPVNSNTIKLNPISASIKNEKGQEKQYQVCSINAMSEFRGYGIDEIRFFDYLTKGLIEAPKNFSSVDIKPSTASSDLFAAIPKKTTSSESEKKPISYGISSVSKDQQLNISYDNVKLPDPKPYPVETSARFFTLKQSKASVSYDEDILQKIPIRQKREDFSHLFEKRTNHQSSQADQKIVIKALRFTPEMLKCGQPIPSVSAFPNINVSSIKKKSIYTIPSLDDVEKDRLVQNFVIQSDGIGSIEFNSPVVVNDFDPMKDSVIAPSFIDMYPNKKNIPRKGSFLNTNATITLYGAWPMDPEIGIRRRIYNELACLNYKNILHEYCERKSLNFVLYDAQNGMFRFTTESFNNGPFQLP